MANKNKSTKSKRMPRHVFEGFVTWRDLDFPPKYNRKGKVVGKNKEHGKRISIALAFDDIPESVIKQAKAEKNLKFVKNELKVKKEYKNRTAWIKGFEKYVHGDFGIDVGDEVMVEATMKVNEGTGKHEGKSFLNFTMKKVTLVESGEELEDEDEELEDEDEDEDEDENENEDEDEDEDEEDLD